MGSNEYTYRTGYKGTVEERMANKTAKAGPTECWNWTGSLDTQGYACIRVDKKLCRASHIAFQLHNGYPVPTGLLIMHSCDNPACVNPAHLSAGTQVMNMADEIRKGRCRRATGEAHWKTKVTARQVAEIRAIFAKESHSYASIAPRFNITPQTLSNIVRRVTWP